MKLERFALSRRNLIKLAGVTAVAIGAGSRQTFAATPKTAELFYTESGAGKSLMLLHGWTGDSHDWSWQLPVLENKYRLVVVDLRGHGASEAKPSGSYLPDDYLIDIEALIDAKFSGEKFIMIGHSMGGQIAARLAAKRPDLVEAVVSVDGSLGFSEDLNPVYQKTTDDLAARDLGTVIPPLFEMFYDETTPAAFRHWHARRPLGMAEPAVRESFGPLFLGDNQVGVGKKSEQFCRSLTVPFYHMCRFPDQAEAMSEWFSNPKSKVELWTGVGHWIQQDRPGDVNAAITAWIDALKI